MIPFDVVLVPFPFADLSSSKKRPCLVLASFQPRSLGEHLVLAMMTSQVNTPHFPFDTLLQDYSKAGLPKPTLLRLSKVVTLHSSMVYKKLGCLADVDRHNVGQQFEQLFGALLGI